MDRENQNIEWKEHWHDEYLKWICGFANAQGGKIYIGKNDKGDVIGVNNAKELLEIIPNKVKNILGIIVDVNLKTENGKEFIEIEVDPYPSPIDYKGQYHFRSGSTKQELTGAALDKFLRKKSGLHWDSIPTPLLKEQELDDTAFKLFAKKAAVSKRLNESILTEKNHAILRKLHLFEGDHLKKAAALLFYEDPEEFVTGAYIKIGFFVTDSELIYQDEIHGNLFSQVDKAMELLTTKYMKAYIRYKGLQRIDEFLFSPEALREALLNAVVHKDYSSCNPIQISVYDDKLYIWNAGELPPELTLEKLQKKHPSIPYNPLIAAAFFRSGYIEAWGRGIEKINTQCDNISAPRPDYNFELGGLMVLFKARNLQESNEQFIQKSSQESSQESSQKSSQKIIALIKQDNSITTLAIASKLNISRRAVTKQITNLKNKGLLKRIGPKKGGYWEIIKKY